jgi:glycosyltransferase involved in cell wall biosynthesis
VSAIAELALVANARIPSERAQSLQVVQAASALARAGVATTLVHARRRRTSALAPGEDVFAHYGVPEGARPAVVAIPCPDWIDAFPRAFQFAPARIQELGFSRNAAAFVAGELPRAVVLSREIECALRLVRGGRRGVFLEVHRVPGGRTRRRWLAEAAARCAGLVAISGGVRDDLAVLGVAGDCVCVEHDGFEAARFRRLPSRAEARAALGLDPSRPVVAYTGGLLAWKGVDVLVDAARLVPGATFVIAGGMADDVARLRARAKDLDNVRIEGFQAPERVALYLAAADAGVVPNRSEPAISARHTSPLKVFEAMAAGLALVASDLPALRELLTHERDAWLVAPDDPRALADGLERLLGDAALRARLGRALSERAREHTWDARAARLLAWFAERLRRGR